jgi:hypothetical protein
MAALAFVGVLELFYERLTITRPHRSDFVARDVRDHSDCVEANLVHIEVKWPRDMNNAKKQVTSYATARASAVAKAKASGIDGEQVLHTYAVATDCWNVVFVRVSTTVTARHISNYHVVFSEPETLYAETEEPPRGFVLLYTLFHSSVEDLGGICDGFPVDMEDLGPRIGRGGWSSVFASVSDEAAVIKVPFTDPIAGTMVARERGMIRTLNDDGECHFLPRLAPLDVGLELSGRALGMAPRGRALQDVLDTYEGDRVELATRVTNDVLAALRHAHGRSIVHCDVRVSNVVMHEGHAVLIDWGLSVQVMSRVTKLVGVPLFADDDVLRGTWTATPKIDLTAAAYLFVAIAFSGGDHPVPWCASIESHRGSVRDEAHFMEIVRAERQEWFNNHPELLGARLLRRVQEGEHLYELPPPDPPAE